MNAVLGSLRRRVFAISPEETTFDRRGFRGGNPRAREQLEKIGPAFAAGYHAALEDDDFAALVPKLSAQSPEFRGFAFEGAAMGLALLDWLTPWKRSRVQAFLQGPADGYTYLVHVGAGWIFARRPGTVERTLARFDPLLRWLVMDGYGFHEGFFHWPRYIQGQRIPSRVSGYAARAFDQGLGRSLWFVDGADAALIPRTIAGFQRARQGDLWSGLGLGATYAGGAGGSALRMLRDSAGDYRPHLAQGAAFGAKARQRAGNIIAHTELAAEVLCLLSAEEAARVTDAALENLPGSAVEPAYETWRRRIQQHFGAGKELRT